MTQKVFVYGTLKRNEPNHHWLTNPDNGKGTFLCEGTTKTKYPLIIGTRYNIPFLLYCPGNGHNVQGEIYEVDEHMMRHLDDLEGHPDYYVREVDDILTGAKEEKCWIYFLKTFKPDLLSRPFLDSYSTRGSHGLPYTERSKRDPKYNYVINEVKP